MDMLKEFVQSDEGKTYHGALLIGRQPNYKRVDATGQFIECLDNNPGISMENNKVKVDDFDTAVYIMNDQVQVYWYRSRFNLVEI